MHCWLSECEIHEFSPSKVSRYMDSHKSPCQRRPSLPLLLKHQSSLYWRIFITAAPVGVAGGWSLQAGVWSLLGGAAGGPTLIVGVCWWVCVRVIELDVPCSSHTPPPHLNTQIRTNRLYQLLLICRVSTDQLAWLKDVVWWSQHRHLDIHTNRRKYSWHMLSRRLFWWRRGTLGIIVYYNIMHTSYGWRPLSRGFFVRGGVHHTYLYAYLYSSGVRAHTKIDALLYHYGPQLFK